MDFRKTLYVRPIKYSAWYKETAQDMIENSTTTSSNIIVLGIGNKAMVAVVKQNRKRVLLSRVLVGGWLKGVWASFTKEVTLTSEGWTGGCHSQKEKKGRRK